MAFSCEPSVDVHPPAGYAVVTLEADGRAKRPVGPYDRIGIEVESTRAGAGAEWSG